MTTAEQIARSAALTAFVLELDELRGQEIDINEFELWEWAFCIGYGPLYLIALDGTLLYARDLFDAAEVSCLLSADACTSTCYRDQAIARFSILKQEIANQ